MEGSAAYNQEAKTSRENLLSNANSSAEKWTPPLIYDPMTDKYRVACQADIDELQKQVARLLGLYHAVSNAVKHVEAQSKS